MFGRVVGKLGRAPVACICWAMFTIAVMYCSGAPSDAQPGVPRGDGEYRPLIARGDGHMHFLITRSIVFDHDLDIDDDLERFGDPWHQPVTATGRKNVMQQIGPSLIWAPLLAVAHGAALIANAFGASIETHGYTLFHQRILFASSVVFAWLAVALGMVVAWRTFSGRWSIALGGVAALLGTSLTYYATYMPSYAHAMDAAAMAGFLAAWALAIGQLRWRRFVVLGLLLGVAAMVRVQDLGFGIVVLAELAELARERRAKLRSLVARGALTLAIALVMFAPQCCEWHAIFGAWITVPQGPGQMRYAHPMIGELLFSARNGWLSNTPIAYVGVIGLVVGAIAGPRLGRRVRLICVALLAAVAVQVYVDAATYDWWGSASFGQRRMCSSTLPVAVGVAALLRAIHLRLGCGRRRVPAAVQLGCAFAFVGYLVAWNLSWVRDLSGGLPAGRDLRATCCDDAPGPLAAIAQPIHDAIGNPFQLPASAVFAIEHGVSLDRYDDAADIYPLVPPLLSFADGSYRTFREIWNVGAPGMQPYLLRGFGPSQQSQLDLFRWTERERADMLLPLLVPEPHHVTLRLAANVAAGRTLDVIVRWNGDVVARGAIGPTWTTLSFDTDGSIGMTELGVAAHVAPDQRRAESDVPRPLLLQPAGVAIGPILLELR